MSVGIAMLAAGAIAAAPASHAAAPQLPEIALSASASTIADVFQAVTFLGDLNFDVVQPAAFRTTDLNHGYLWSVFNGIPPYGDGTPALDEPMLSVINFITSPLSGVLLGTLGPALGPWVELANSLQIAFASLSDGDFAQAFQDLLAVPGNVFDAFLNGTTLDLSAILPLVDESGLFPPGALSGLGLELGGLLTEGVTIGDPADFDPGNPENLGIGGSIWNAISLHFPGDGSGDIVGEAVGPVAAFTNLWDVIIATLDLGGAE